MISHFKWEVYTVLACDLVAPLLRKLGGDLIAGPNVTMIKSFLDLCLTGQLVPTRTTLLKS